MKLVFSIHLLIFIIILAGCAAHTSIQPAGKGNLKGNLSIGGPIIAAFGTNIPVPYGTAGMNYGFSDNMNVNANFHLMSLAYKTGGMDIGFSWFPVSNNGIIPTIAIEPRCLALLSLKKDIQTRFIVYPLITSTAAWQCKNGLLYSGLDFILPLSDSDYDDDASSTIISPFIGYGWKLGNNYALFTELKWMGANIRSDQLAVEYLPIARYGAVTPLISLERSF